MRRISTPLTTIAVLFGLLLLPRAARADGYVAPWAGVQFGQSVGDGRGAFGVTAGGMSGGIFGAEVDFGYSPSFFGSDNDFGHNTVIDLMGNLIVGVPVGSRHGASVRPYLTAGLGLIRTQIDGGTLFNVSSSNNRLGWDAGGGVMGFFSEHVGLRGDLRFLEYTGGNVVNNVDLGRLNFWRASMGVVIR